MDATNYKTAAMNCMRNGDFADFSIKFGYEEQKVHRVILANQSRYFERLFKNDFAETRAQYVTLQDDVPRIVRLMLEYFYGFEYHSNADKDDGIGDLELHARVYAIGHKYESMDLKALAAAKFARSAAAESVLARAVGLPESMQWMQAIYKRIRLAVH